VSREEASGGELSPETLRLVARVAAGLGLAAGALAVVAFVLGIVREGEARWVVLALGGVMLALPLVVSRLVRGAR
jgi:hypothetical protein